MCFRGVCSNIPHLGDLQHLPLQQPSTCSSSHSMGQANLPIITAFIIEASPASMSQLSHSPRRITLQFRNPKEDPDPTKDCNMVNNISCLTRYYTTCRSCNGWQLEESLVLSIQIREVCHRCLCVHPANAVVTWDVSFCYQGQNHHTTSITSSSV